MMAGGCVGVRGSEAQRFSPDHYNAVGRRRKVYIFIKYSPLTVYYVYLLGLYNEKRMEKYPKNVYNMLIVLLSIETHNEMLIISMVLRWVFFYKRFKNNDSSV